MVLACFSRHRENALGVMCSHRSPSCGIASTCGTLLVVYSAGPHQLAELQYQWPSIAGSLSAAMNNRSKELRLGRYEAGTSAAFTIMPPSTSPPMRSWCRRGGRWDEEKIGMWKQKHGPELRKRQTKKKAGCAARSHRNGAKVGITFVVTNPFIVTKLCQVHFEPVLLAPELNL